MSLAVGDQPVPLEADSDGVLRVARTRVTLDTVVAAFEDGATAEEIAEQYPTVSLGDIYAVIAYYLRQRDDVAAYLRQRRQQAEAVRQDNLARCPPQGIRTRLLARRTG